MKADGFCFTGRKKTAETGFINLIFNFKETGHGRRQTDIFRSGNRIRVWIRNSMPAETKGRGVVKSGVEEFFFGRQVEPGFNKIAK